MSIKTAKPGRLVVGWKVSALDRYVASVRYRSLLPALALREQGIESRVFSKAVPEQINDLDALVVVKSLAHEDLILVDEASRRSVPVILDLCDNIFVRGYVGKGSRCPADIFLEMAMSAAAITTTTSNLAEVIRRKVGPGVPVFIAPDGIDDLSDRRQRRLVWISIIRSEIRTLPRKLRTTLSSRSARHSFRILQNAIRYALVCGLRAARSFPIGNLSAPRFELTKMQPSSPPARINRCRKRVLWIGNHGARYANFGISDLFLVRHALERIATEMDVELLVVSNDRAKYEKIVRPFAIPSRYFEWSPRIQAETLAGADVFLVPNSLDEFSICKSANRTVLALMNGVPVVATPTPALEPLFPFIEVGDPYTGLKRYLCDPNSGRADVSAANAVISALYGAQTLGQRWRQIFDDTLARAEVRRRDEVASPRVVICLHLIQDLDLAIPVIREMDNRRLPYQVWVSVSLTHKSPRVVKTLNDTRARWRAIPDTGISTFLVRFPESARAVLAVAETNLSPHRFNREIICEANKRGLATFCMQHGFENVGLTYSDPVHAIEKIEFAARHIFIWGSLDTLRPDCPPTVRARCIPVGCPKPPLPDRSNEIASLFEGGRRVIGIFENLHWERYTDAYRQHVLQTVLELARVFSEFVILIKPHHAGMWVSKLSQEGRPSATNIVIAEPSDPRWEPYTAGQLMNAMSAVITTPSTVALDAARMGLPVAVMGFELPLSNYAPLPVLKSEKCCVEFVRAAHEQNTREQYVQRAAQFVHRAILPGNAAREIVSRIQDSIA